MRLKNPIVKKIIGETIKINQELIGTKNGSNRFFQTPTKFLYNSVNSPMIDINGKSAYFGKDILSFTESGGPGTGFDTVEFIRPPKKNHELFATYIEV